MSTTRLVSPALARAAEHGSLVRVGDERLVVELERDRLNAPSLRIVVSEALAPGTVAAFEPMPSLLEQLPRALDPLFDPFDGGGCR